VTQPALTDEYWFTYSKDLVESALKRRDEAAAKLQTLLGWFWVIYTSAAAVVATVGNRLLPTHLIIFVSAPVILLLISYWICSQAQMPRLVRFDYRRPRDIASAYEATLTCKTRWLRLAQILTASAAASVAAALFVANTIRASEIPNWPLRKLQIDVHRTPKALYVRTDAYLPGAKTLEMMARPILPAGPARTWRLALQNGKQVEDFALPPAIREFMVIATYYIEDEQVTTEKRLKSNPLP
jgi:hypothetical protein